MLKTNDLDLNTFVEEQLNDPVLQRPTKTHDIEQYKALLSSFNRFEQLLIEKTNLLCDNKTVQETWKTEMKICVPLSLFLPLFSI